MRRRPVKRSVQGEAPGYIRAIRAPDPRTRRARTRVGAVNNPPDRADMGGYIRARRKSRVLLGEGSDELRGVEVAVPTPFPSPTGDFDGSKNRGCEGVSGGERRR